MLDDAELDDDELDDAALDGAELDDDELADAVLDEDELHGGMARATFVGCLGSYPIRCIRPRLPVSHGS